MKLLAITAVALLVAACGSTSPKSPSTTGSASNSPAAAALTFATCMRDHGIANFPVPQVTVTTTPGGGSVAIREAAPAGLGGSPKLEAAQNACKGLQQAIGNSVAGPRGPSRQAFLAFARCLRSHGLSTFPDPDAQGQITGQMITAAGVNTRSPAFVTAARACVGVTHGQITKAMVAAVASGRH
jgi:hypothetical protein